MNASPFPERASTMLAPPTPADTCSMEPVERTNPRRMDRDECLAALGRNTAMTVSRALDDGDRRATRERYVYSLVGCFLPASLPLSGGLLHHEPRMLECEISEFDGLRAWRYVWLRGAAFLLQPTGDAPEREAWQHGLEQLRRVMRELPATQELKFANFGIVRLEPIDLHGEAVVLDDVGVA